MLLIDQKGKRIRPICRACKKLHAPKDCPTIDRRIWAILAAQEPPWDRQQIAALVGVSVRRVQHSFGILMRRHEERKRAG